jgi:hypothetical protein
VGIITHNGKHTYGEFSTNNVSSCARLPGSDPLYLIVKPDDQSCEVEARLYYLCDEADQVITTLVDCEAIGTFIESTTLPVGRIYNSAPFVLDASASRDAAADASTDARRTSTSDAARDVGGGS